MKTPEDLYENIAYDVAVMMTKLTTKYRGSEPLLASALCDSLGCFIALVAQAPEEVLPEMAERLKATNWEQLRLRHFGFKLGLAETSETPEPPVVRMGASREKPV